MSDNPNEITQDMLAAIAILREAALCDSWDDLNGELPDMVFKILSQRAEDDDDCCCGGTEDRINREITPKITAMIALYGIRFLLRTVPQEMIDEFLNQQELNIIATEAEVNALIEGTDE